MQRKHRMTKYNWLWWYHNTVAYEDNASKVVNNIFEFMFQIKTADLHDTNVKTYTWLQLKDELQTYVSPKPLTKTGERPCAKT